MKSKKHIRFYCLIAFLMMGCSSRVKIVDEGYYMQDFDNLNFWSRNQLISPEKAHSGDFSTYTDSTHEYSQTFEMDLAYAKSKGYKSLHLSAWCYKSVDASEASLIASVESPEKNLAYSGIDLKDELKTSNEWKQVSTSLKFPDNGPDGSKIKIYIWSPQKQKFFLDDIEIQFEK